MSTIKSSAKSVQSEDVAVSMISLTSPTFSPVASQTSSSQVSSKTNRESFQKL